MNKELLGYALRLLNRRDYTEKQIRKKLFNKSKSEDEVNEIVDYLKEKNFINDRRFAENYVYFRTKKGYGIARIKQELKEKGIEENLIDEVLDSAEDRAESTFLKKLNQLKGKTRKRQKLFDFMYRRGFDSERIVELLNKYEVRDNENC